MSTNRFLGEATTDALTAIIASGGSADGEIGLGWQVLTKVPANNWCQIIGPGRRLPAAPTRPNYSLIIPPSADSAILQGRRLIAARGRPRFAREGKREKGQGAECSSSVHAHAATATPVTEGRWGQATGGSAASPRVGVPKAATQHATVADITSLRVFNIF